MRPVLIPLFLSGLLGFLATGCGPLPAGSDSGTPIVSVTTETTGEGAGISETSIGNNSLAQSFSLSSASSVSRVAAYLMLVGTFPSNSAHTLDLRIETDSSSAPSGTLAASGATASLSVISVTSTATTQHLFTLSSAASLSAGTTYWIRITGSYALNGTNYIKWAAHNDNVTDLYTGGLAKYLNGSSAWSTLTFGTLKDFLFQLYP